MRVESRSGAEAPGSSQGKSPVDIPPTASSALSRRQIITLLVLGTALAIIVIDATVVSVAFYSIQKDFKVSYEDLEWIVSLYALVFGSFLLIWGKLGDEFGRKRIFIGGVALFVLGSLIDGFSNNLSSMLVGRGIQGFGAAMASPSTLSILTTTFTGKARGIAFGIWAAIAGAAAVIGPVMGGYFTTYVTWRWAFFINAPLGAAAIIGALVIIKESRFRDPKYTTDYAGVTLITLSLSALLFGFIEAQTYGWLTPNSTFTLAGLSWPANSISLPAFSIVSGFVLLGAFALVERRRQQQGKDALFDISLLKFKGFRYGIITVTIVSMGEFAVIYFLSIYLQAVRGLSAINSGLTFLPLAVCLFLTAPSAGILSNRIGPKWIITAGMVLEAIAIFSLSLVTSLNNPIYYFYPVLAVYGVGIGLALGQLISTVLASVPWNRAGVASGTNNTVRQIGAAFGVAVIGAVLVAQISAVGHAGLAASTVIPDQLKASLGTALNSGLAGGPASYLPASIQGTPLAAAIVAVLNDAITQGVRQAALTASVFVALGAVSSLLIPNPKAVVKAKVPVAAAGKVSVISRSISGKAVSLIMTVQFVAILGLLASLSSEYMSNSFMRQWFGDNAWPLGLILNDYLGVILVGIVGVFGLGWRIAAQRVAQRRAVAAAIAIGVENN